MKKESVVYLEGETVLTFLALNFIRIENGVMYSNVGGRRVRVEYAEIPNTTGSDILKRIGYTPMTKTQAFEDKTDYKKHVESAITALNEAVSLAHMAGIFCDIRTVTPNDPNFETEKPKFYLYRMRKDL